MAALNIRRCSPAVSVEKSDAFMPCSFISSATALVTAVRLAPALAIASLAAFPSISCASVRPLDLTHVPPGMSPAHSRAGWRCSTGCPVRLLALDSFTSRRMASCRRASRSCALTTSTRAALVGETS